MTLLVTTHFASRMRRLAASTLVAFTGALAAPLVAPVAAQPANTATPRPRATSATSSTAFVADRLARVDRWMDSLVAAKRVPGAVVMLVRDGRVEHHRAYGVRDLDTRAPMRTDDIFRIASQTKAITSLAVMMLWEEGRFGLDDPIARYIPAFGRAKVLTKFNAADSSYETRDATRQVTIRQLLTHTSGIDYADIGSAPFRAVYAKAGLSAIGRDGDVLGRSIDVLAKLPLAHDPGERFTYGLSVDVLGRLVEVVSGMPLDRFFRTRIFEPLRMRDTWFELPADRRSRLVSLHVDSAGVLRAQHGAALGAGADYPAHPMTYFSGGAGLSSTTADYARFLQLFLNGGELDGTRLLGRKTVELMLTNQIASIQGAFGLGFALETPDNDFRSPVSVGTFSWSGAFKTYYWADPKERLVGLLFTNISGGNTPLDGPFKTMVYSALR